MQNTFNSNNQLWTEIALSSGWIEVLAGADNLTVMQAAELNAIKARAVANSFLAWHDVNKFIELLKEMFQREPGTTD